MLELTYTDEKGTVLAVNGDAIFVPGIGDSVSLYDYVESKQRYFTVLFRQITEKGEPRLDGILDTEHDYITIALKEQKR